MLSPGRWTTLPPAPGSVQRKSEGGAGEAEDEGNPWSGYRQRGASQGVMVVEPGFVLVKDGRSAAQDGSSRGGKARAQKEAQQGLPGRTGREAQGLSGRKGRELLEAWAVSATVLKGLGQVTVVGHCAPVSDVYAAAIVSILLTMLSGLSNKVGCVIGMAIMADCL